MQLPGGVPLGQEAGQRHDADGRRGQQEARQDLAHRREHLDLGIEPSEEEIEGRHQDDDEQGVEELKLVGRDRVGQPGHVQVHVVARESDPERVVVLVAHPEDHDQSENAEQPEHRLPLKFPLLGGQLGMLGRFRGIVPLAGREDRQRGDHQPGRELEGGRVPEVVAQHGHGHLGNERPDVDGKVEPQKRGTAEPLLARPLLVVGLAHERRNVRLDHAAAARQQSQGDDQRRVVFNAQDEMAQHVGHGKADDGPVAAQPPVGNEPAHQRQEVTRHLEPRVDGAGFRVGVSQGRGQVEEQDGPHAVVGAALGELAPEEEPQRHGVPVHVARCRRRGHRRYGHTVHGEGRAAVGCGGRRRGNPGGLGPVIHVLRSLR